jgi:hypothetical protein
MAKEFRAKTPIIACTVSGQRETLYTCPPNCRASVPLVYIVNANGTVSVVFEIYKAAVDDHFFIIAGKNLATGETIQLSESYIVLEPGDKLEVTPTGSDPLVDALCTVEETFIPLG